MEPQDFESKDYDYGKTWADIYAQRQKAISQRTDLETELMEIRNKIAHLDQVLDHIGPLAGMSSGENDFLKLGLTDAIREVLGAASQRMSAQDVRNTLSLRGYDLSSLTAPMQSIYKILGRLADDSHEVEREREDGRVFYRWKRLTAPVTDEDIPF